MTRPTRDANVRRLGLVLAALTAVLVTLFGPGTASAAESPGAQSRVGIHTPQTQVVVGTQDGIDAGRRLECSPSTCDSVLATGAAAENPVAAALRLASEYSYDGAAPSYDASVLIVDAHTVVQVEAVGRQATVVPLRLQVGAASEGSVGVAGFVVAAKTASAGWKVGDDVYAATKAGNNPAWSTVRSRFWKNSAADSKTAGQWDEGNLARMQSGRSPQRFNPDKGGRLESMELSHEPIPFRNGGRDFVPRWPQDHAAVDPFRFPGY